MIVKFQKPVFEVNGWPISIPMPEKKDFCLTASQRGRQCSLEGWLNVMFFGVSQGTGSDPWTVKECLARGAAMEVFKNTLAGLCLEFMLLGRGEASTEDLSEIWRKAAATHGYTEIYTG